jgi:hypothetical protein
MFQAVSPPIIRSSTTLRTASGICQAFMPLLLAWLRWNRHCSIWYLSNLYVVTAGVVEIELPCSYISTTQAVAAYKLDKYQML